VNPLDKETVRHIRAIERQGDNQFVRARGGKTEIFKQTDFWYLVKLKHEEKLLRTKAWRRTYPTNQ